MNLLFRNTIHIAAINITKDINAKEKYRAIIDFLKLKKILNKIKQKMISKNVAEFSYVFTNQSGRTPKTE